MDPSALLRAFLKSMSTLYHYVVSLSSEQVLR